MSLVITPVRGDTLLRPLNEILLDEVFTSEQALEDAIVSSIPDIASTV